MAVYRCKICGANLEVVEGQNIITCEYCDSTQAVPSIDNEKKINLYNRANRLRLACEFDKAASIYENIVAEFPEEAEGYWGLLLCNYGIEYVDDPATGRKVPTCHRASFESIQKDDNYQLALEYADLSAQKLYKDETREIERIMSEILMVSQKEQAYDIFICYKETDEKGKRTVDSVLAQDIYSALTEKGYRVFFSRISLEEKLGQQYEPYIFAALNSAKVMLVVGTTYENFHAVWVKNEWSRFLKFIAKDKTKFLIPCYKDMDAYDMPEEFRGLQAQDLGKIGANQDLIRGIEKLIPRTSPMGSLVSGETSINGAIDGLIKRIELFMEERDAKQAETYCERALDIAPTDYRPYWYKMMLSLGLFNETELSEYTYAIDKNKHYWNAIKFCPEKTRGTLLNYGKITKENEERVINEIRVEREKSNKEIERIKVEMDKLNEQKVSFENSKNIIEKRIKKEQDLEKEYDAFSDSMQNSKNKILVSFIICLIVLGLGGLPAILDGDMSPFIVMGPALLWMFFHIANYFYCRKNYTDEHKIKVRELKREEREINGQISENEKEANKYKELMNQVQKDAIAKIEMIGKRNKHFN